MDRHEQSELISAYLDGEATPEERAEVERLLETSPELRAQLDDFARLSDLLRALPRESAPPELAAAIRQQAQQKSLLIAEPVAPKRSLHRELFAAIGGMAVTAAGLALTVPWLQHEEPRSSATVYAPTSNVAGMKSMEHAGDMPVALRDAAPEREFLAKQNFRGEKAASPAGDISPTAPLAAPPAPAATEAPAAKTAFGASSRSAANANGVAAKYGAAAPELGDEEAAADSEVVRDLVHIGDMLPYLERTSDGVAVVELTVVDIQEAGGQFEVLLSGHGLQVIGQDQAALTEADRADSKRDASKKSRGTAQSPQMVTVYVDAPRETIAEVLDEMVQQHLVSRAKLQPPVDSQLMAAEGGGNAVLKEQLERGELKNVEQSVVDKAVGASQNYAAARQLTDAHYFSESKEGQQTSRKAKGEQNRSREQQQVLRRSDRRAGKLDQGWIAGKDADAKQSVSGPEGVHRLQNNAVVLKLDPETLQAVSDLSRQAAKPAAIPAENKKGSQEKAKADGESRAVDKTSNAAERLAESESDEAPLEPTVRVLFVLQRAETP